MRTSLLLLALGLSVAACDSTASETDPPGTPGEPADEFPTVHAADRGDLGFRIFNVYLYPTGAIRQHFRGSDPTTVTAVSALYEGALWLAGQQEGAMRAAAYWHGFSTYGSCPDVESDVFVLDADTTYSADGWPSEVGAPVTPDGAPQVYGDRMAWTTSCPQTDGASLDRPFIDLRVNTALFGHDALPHVVFVRYEIRNESTHLIRDAYAGFWSDPDLASLPWDNLIGYDSDAQIGYVYLDPTNSDEAPRPDSERGEVAAVQILEAPNAASLAAHRMMDKHNTPFAQPTIDSVEDYAFALRGLDYEGNPMVDPTTGQPTTFAYPGDPVALTGWIDGFDYCGGDCGDEVQTGEELRQLISAGPFDLEPSETGVFTVAYVVQFGSDLADGLARLRRDMASLRSQPALWQFAPQD